MNDQDVLAQQFMTLRDEIKAIKARLYWTVVLGVFGVPILIYLASDARRDVWLLVPYTVLILIVVFVAEQNAMMRAGRYIRERIEPNVEQFGWEGWLEAHVESRLMERHFVACFVVIFFIYYVMTIAMAIQRLLSEEARDPSGQFTYWLGAAGITYAIGAIWAVSTLVHHWRSTVSTVTHET